MIRHLSLVRSSFAVGTVTALFHLIWAVMVAFGVAKPFMDFVLNLHFVELQYELMPYSSMTAGALVVLTFVLGAMFGLMFAIVWNWLGSGTQIDELPARKGLLRSD